MPDPLQKILEKMTPEEKEMFKMRMELMKKGFITTSDFTDHIEEFTTSFTEPKVQTLQVTSSYKWYILSDIYL